MVVIALPNCVEHYLAALGAWKVGACALPVSPAMPPVEREKMLALAGRVVPVDDREGFATAISGESVEPLSDVISRPGKAIGSGGSTGLPKIIVDPNPWARDPDGFGRTPYGLVKGQVQLVAGPLYHNSPFGLGHLGLFADHTLVVMERFDAALAVDLIERHRVQWAFLVPTMMARIARLPDLEPSRLGSLEAIMHTAAPCPPWVKRAWIDLIGAERVYELFGAAEAVGSTMIRGDEWLAHPGSLGRPYLCEMKILDQDLNQVRSGEVGEIFMRSTLPGPTYEYRGAQARRTPDGFESVGDLGWVDGDGYLYLADRRVDLIITGGANIYPAEVEAALSEHPAVADVAVVGVPHGDLGKTVHAIVEVRSGHPPPSPDELDAYCAARLARYKVPRTFEIIDRLPRNEAGKIRRSQLAEERASAPPA
jgi:bile acid-coenzyme A ligase